MEIVEYSPRAASTVEAVQVTQENIDDVAFWCGGETVDIFDQDNLSAGKRLNVPTLIGVSPAMEGDYVVRLHGARFGVMSQRSFEHEYVAV